MPDDPIKKRMARAKARAQAQLRGEEYTVIASDNRPVCIIAFNADALRVIRICLDAPSASDKALMRGYKQSPGASVELWVSKIRSHGFSIVRV